MDSLAGYSPRNLIDKLGYKRGDFVTPFQAPDWFIDELSSHEVILVADLPASWAHAFFVTKDELLNYLETTDLALIEKGLWVSWPKKASKVETDLTEQDFRDQILPLGWVDTKVCAIDETWSGLKFLRRKA